MRILYINAMGPKERSPQRGVFVSQRIKALKGLDVDVIPIFYDVEYSNFVKKILRKIVNFPDFGEPLNKQIGIAYDVIKIRFGIWTVIASKINAQVFRRKVSKTLEEILDKLSTIDIIHLHWLWPAGVGIAYVAQKRKIPYVITCHGSDINFSMQDPFLKKAIINILENASAVEFISEALKKKAIESGYSGKNAVVIYNGINTEYFHPDEVKDVRKKRVGFVGNLIAVKGADRLFDIFSRISNQLKDSVDFVIVGQGNQQNELRKKMENLPVRFTGVLTPEELAKEYKKMDVLVVPSRNEGYSCVAKEAQACGVIPIGNDVGGIKEAIGEFGKVVSETDEELLCKMLADATIEILKDKSKVNRSEMMKEASKCSWRERQKQCIKVYQSIIEKNS